MPDKPAVYRRNLSLSTTYIVSGLVKIVTRTLHCQKLSIFRELCEYPSKAVANACENQ